MTPTPGPARGRAPAFTLLELLVATAFGAILLGAILTMATSLLRAGVRDDNQQTAQEAWARLHQFLAIEVGEAGRFYLSPTDVTPIDAIAPLNQPPSDCAGANQDPASESFSIRVPNSDSSGGVPYRTITYYVRSNNLMRCGPPVQANGALDFAAPSTEAVLSFNTVLRQLRRDHDNRSIAYTLEFRSPHAGVEYSGQGRAWAQSSMIQVEDGLLDAEP